MDFQHPRAALPVGDDRGAAWHPGQYTHFTEGFARLKNSHRLGHAGHEDFDRPGNDDEERVGVPVALAYDLQSRWIVIHPYVGPHLLAGAVVAPVDGNFQIHAKLVAMAGFVFDQLFNG